MLRSRSQCHSTPRRFVSCECLDCHVSVGHRMFVGWGSERRRESLRVICQLNLSIMLGLWPDGLACSGAEIFPAQCCPMALVDTRYSAPQQVPMHPQIDDTKEAAKGADR
eukprot:scaffold71486_cov30-Tisochrysis_lutea.AAC.4